MRRYKRFAAVGLVVLMAGTLGGCGRPQRWRHELLSMNASGTASGNAMTVSSESFSPDGSKVAFASVASDLGGTDTNNVSDVYIRELATGVTTLVSHNAAGTDAANGESLEPQFSPDGTKLAFVSQASDLGPQDSNNVQDVYLYDLASGIATLVSANAANTDSGNGPSRISREVPAFSPDSTKLVFSSGASNFGPDDTNGTHDVYARDLVGQTTMLVSANASGTNSANGASAEHRLPSFDPTGTKVVFETLASDLGAPDTNGTFDVFVRDLAAGSSQLISRTSSGSTGNDASAFALFSPQGTWIVYRSWAMNIVTGDSDSVSDVYLYDVATGTTRIVSTGSGDFGHFEPVVSADESKIAFFAAYSTGDHRGFVVDLVAPAQQTIEGASGPLRFSDDGTLVAFTSEASYDLPDTNYCPSSGGFEPCTDVFVRNLETGVISMVSTNADGTDSGDSWSNNPQFRPGTHQISFASLASNLVAGDTNETVDVFLASPTP